MATRGIAPAGAGPELSSFGAHLEQHLTEVEVGLDPGEGKAWHVETLGMLTALRTLKFGCCPRPLGEPHSYCNLSREKLGLKLQHLVCLWFIGFEEGELTLSCPKLAEAMFQGTNNVRIELEDAVPTSLRLTDCKDMQFAVTSPETQLQELADLAVIFCSEVGRHLIEDAGHMRRLEKLDYKPFPAARMPKCFPQSLCRLDLFALDWFQDLPAGLKDLHQLKDFWFSTDCSHWDVKRPLPELLPMDSPKLEIVSIGCHFYFRHGPEPKGPFEYAHNPGKEGLPRRFIKL